MPTSGLKRAIAGVLKEEGYIWDFGEIPTRPAPTLRIKLKYGPEGEMVIQGVRRASRPGRRLYRPVDRLPQVRGGAGTVHGVR